MAENKTTIGDINDDTTRSGELSEEDVAKISGGQREIKKVETDPVRTQTIIDTIHSNGTRTDDLIDSD